MISPPREFRPSLYRFEEVGDLINLCYLTSWVGDYHAPRLCALDKKISANGGRLSVVQFGSSSGFYGHQQARREKLVAQLDYSEVASAGFILLMLKVFFCLLRRRPSHILVLGYNDAISLTALIYARLFGRKIFFCSDSKADDQERSPAKELIKRAIIRLYDGALVAGEKHKKYFRSLGFRASVALPYDVVDNDYFYARAMAYRRHISSCPQRFVLCVSRLVPRKRVELAIDTYLRSRVYESGVYFVLVGDGPENDSVQEIISESGVSRFFMHYKSVANHKMPIFYAFAEVLILMSEYDQWGLCVNEAMACGVPCIVSERCGVADEIVMPDTGYVVRDDDIDGAAGFMQALVNNPLLRGRMSEACIDKMRQWCLDDFAEGVYHLVSGGIK